MNHGTTLRLSLLMFRSLLCASTLIAVVFATTGYGAAQAIGEIARVKPTTGEGLIHTIAGLSGDVEFLVNSAQRRVGGDPHLRTVEAARLIRAMIADPWLEGGVVLGAYDEQTRKFAVERIWLRPAGPPTDPYNRAVEIAFANPDAAAFLEVPPAEARPILELGSGSKSVSLLVRAREISAEILKSGVGKLYVDPTEIYVYRREGANGPTRVLAHWLPASPLPVKLVPGWSLSDYVGTLDHETLDLLILKKDPTRLEVMAERMFYERFLIETSTEYPPRGQFFDSTERFLSPADHELLFRRFKEWTMERLALLPHMFLLRQNGLKAPANFCGEAAVLLQPDPLFDAFDRLTAEQRRAQFDALRREVLGAPRQHLQETMFFGIGGRRIFAPPACDHPAIPEVRARLGSRIGISPYSLIVLDGVPLPAGAVYADLLFSEYQIDIKGVDFVDNEPTPSVRLRATAVNGMHFQPPGRGGPGNMITLTPADFGR